MMLKHIIGIVAVMGILLCAIRVDAIEARMSLKDPNWKQINIPPSILSSMSLETMEEYLSLGGSSAAVMIASELKRRNDLEAKDVILRALDHQTNSMIRMLLAQALYNHDRAEAKVYLRQLVNDSHLSVAIGAAAILATEDKDALNQVQMALDSKEGSISETTARSVLQAVVTSPVLYDKASSIMLEKRGLNDWLQLLYSGPRPEAIEWMRPYTMEPYDETTRLAAIRSITSFKDSTLVLPILIPLIDDPSEAVAKVAIGHIAFRADRSDWHITPFANSITLEEARRQIKQWWAEESAKAQNPDSVQ